MAKINGSDVSQIREIFTRCLERFGRENRNMLISFERIEELLVNETMARFQDLKNGISDKTTELRQETPPQNALREYFSDRLGFLPYKKKEEAVVGLLEATIDANTDISVKGRLPGARREENAPEALAGK